MSTRFPVSSSAASVTVSSACPSVIQENSCSLVRRRLPLAVRPYRMANPSGL